MRRARWIPIGMLATTLLGAAVGRAAPYDFVVIAAAQPGPFANFFFGTPPSLDADGAVAFVATTPSSASAELFVGTGPGVAIGDYEQITGIQGQGTVSVDGVGTFRAGVAAMDATVQGQRGVYLGSGGLLTSIFTGTAFGTTDPAVNTSGDLAVVQAGKLLVSNALGSSVVLEHNDPFAGGTIFDVPNSVFPDIDDAGQIALYADIDFPSGVCDEAFLRTFPDSVIALGFDPACDFVASGSVPIALNARGSIAYAPHIFDPVDGELAAAFVDSTQIWDERIPGFGTLPSVSDIALDLAGNVAMRIESTSGSGVYVGPDPVADKVIATGDAICDSVVTEVDFHRFGLDDAGRLALFVQLDDGRRLIVRAEPSTGAGGDCVTTPVPEPSAALGAIAALATLARAVRRRRGDAR